MADLISRQAAIDAILGITPMRNTIPLDSAIFNIKKLPSARSEIIYCGECKYMMPNGRCSVFADPSIRPSASDYCSSAERKQDEPELKHGKWIKNEGRHGWHCSECMKDNCYAYAWSSETGSEAILQEVLQDYYCPNCGAKMDGEESQDA